MQVSIKTALSSVIVWSLTSAACADTYSFIKVDESNTDAFGIPAINNLGTVAYPRFTTTQVNGVYVGTGSIYVGDGKSVTKVIGSNDQFSQFDRISINDSGTMAFEGVFRDGGTGILTDRAGAPPVTIALQSPTLSSFGPPKVNAAGTVVFEATTGPTGTQGIFTGNGQSLTQVVATDPAGSGYRRLGQAVAINASGTIAFQAEPADGTAAVYRLVQGSTKPTLVAGPADNTSATNNVGINSSGTVVTDAVTYVFNEPQYGVIFTRMVNGPLIDVADTRTGYHYVGAPSINDRGQVAFIADLNLPGNPTAFYSGSDPASDRLFTFDTLFGAKVSSIQFDPDGAFNNKGQYTVMYQLADHREGIAIATPVALPGDADLNGTVNFNDLLILTQHYGNTGDLTNGDFNGDGIVGFDDLLALAQHYGQSEPATTAAPIPEPAVAAAVPLLAALSVRRKRR